MREILFRGKCFYNGKWVKGFIAASRENMYPNGFEMITVDGINYNEIDGCIPHFTSYVVDPSTIGQYTGVTDKNGTKIFEGDICEVTTFTYDGVYTHLLGGVCFKCCSFVFQDLKHPDIEVLFSSVCDFDTDVEVIGNINDNPELVGGESNG